MSLKKQNSIRLLIIIRMEMGYVLSDLKNANKTGTYENDKSVQKQKDFCFIYYYAVVNLLRYCFLLQIYYTCIELIVTTITALHV